MKTAGIVAAALLQLAVLAYMAGEREFVRQTGAIVWLRTAPIDPRDVFRGDYVRLNYDVSSIPERLIQGVKGSELKRNATIYVAIRTGEEGGLAEVTRAGVERPRDGLFLRARVESSWRGVVRVSYGLEAYFVEQGRGVEIERQRFDPQGRVTVPLEMEVAVDGSGTAVLRGHRWSPLGIGVDLERLPVATGVAPAPDGTASGASGVAALPPRSPVAKVRLMNASDRPLAIVDLPNHGSFCLEPLPTASHGWQMAQPRESSAAPQDRDVRILAPKEVYETRIDLNQPEWFVVGRDQTPRGIGGLDWGDQFRMVYRPPGKDACQGLEHAHIIWHGYLSSRAFSGRGRID